jgi:glycosyltransferase involved in cell wall biosynthesis
LYRILDIAYSVRVLSILPAADVLVTNTIWLPVLIRDSRYGALYVHVGRYPKRQVWFYRHAARLPAPSTAVARAIARQSPRCAGKIRAIPYPVASAAETSAIGNSWSCRGKTILYVGRVHPEKGLVLLLEGFARFARSADPDWRLMVVGPWETQAGGGGQSYYERLRAISAPLAGRVELVGPVFERRLLEGLYRKARLFCYPSLAETGESFGLAPLEAMSAGCPALVSDLGCFSDYITDGRTGFVFDHRSGDPASSLADRLSQITSEPANFACIAEQARRVAARFALPLVTEMFLEDFARLAADRASTELSGLQQLQP